jgi:hypothetical protein
LVRFGQSKALIASAWTVATKSRTRSRGFILWEEEVAARWYDWVSVSG